MRFETRISSNSVHGVTPVLRPRLPSSCSSVGVVPKGLVALGRNPRMHGSCNWPVGEYFVEYTGPHAGFTAVLGRPVNDESCILSPLPVMMLNGRPEFTSTIGANVQSLISFLPNPPPRCPVWYTALNTKRWRWSKSDDERSSLGKKLSCGVSVDCRSVESS